MNNVHEILSHIPHEHIQSPYVKSDERFDVFKLGIFKVARSVLHSLMGRAHVNQPTEEIVELVELQADATYRPHYHKRSSAVIYMVLGEGVFVIDDMLMPYQPGQRLDIPANAAHGFFTKTKTLFLSIQTPPIRNRVTGEVDLHYAKD